MKKLTATLAILLLYTIGNAQLYVDTLNNWQQLIPTILGGNCVSISNVTYNAGQNSSARFTTQNGFMGLGKGLLITTGRGGNAVGPNNSTLKSSDLDLNGDPLLNSLIPSYSTYDAVVLEFDFMSPIDDSVYVKYVFASEEYPEFVGTQFNDLFGFFVSGPGFTNQNIALIPGTTTPVAINNLNQNSFNQFYVDNTDGAECQYDGYTTPLMAYFVAQANVTYHLKIAIADAGDHIYDSGVFLESYPTIWNPLTGNVNHLGQPASAGIVELFGYNTDSTEANLIVTQPINTDGSFQFANVPSGAYILRSTLDTTVYPNTYPKYFNSATLWGNADIITMPCDTFDIAMQLMVIGTGTGEVGGTISQTSSHEKSMQSGKPMAGIHVFCIGNADNLVHGYSITDSQGHYQFKHLNEGQYAIYVDIPGKVQEDAHTVTIAKNGSNYESENYFVSEKIYLQDILPKDLEANLYPNPVTDNVTIQLNMPESSTVTIDAFDVAGRSMGSLYNGTVKEGYNVLPLSIGYVQAGIYYIRILSGNKKKMLKLIKTDN